jgi:hypothetical protein
VKRGETKAGMHKMGNSKEARGWMLSDMWFSSNVHTGVNTTSGRSEM